MNTLRLPPRLVLVASTLLALALDTPGAQADVIGPPPPSCPEGSTSVDLCHGPPTCRAINCDVDLDCAPGMRCAERRICVREHCCSGRGCGLPTAVYYTHVEGPCSPGGDCSDATLTCSSLRVCVSSSGGMDAGRADDGGSREDAGRAEGGGSGLDAAQDEGDAGGGLDSGAHMDGGGSDDGGQSTLDSGSGRDAGGPAGRGGGCCAVLGARGEGVGISLTVAAVVFVAARLAHRRRTRRRAARAIE